MLLRIGRHIHPQDAAGDVPLPAESLRQGSVAVCTLSDLVVDVHRNGYGKLYKGKRYCPTAELDEEKYAKLMFVIGLDYDSSKGEYSYENNPYWKENFKLVFLLIQKLEEKVPGICSGIALRKTPYNQGLAPNSLLLEVGFEGNLVSAEVLAEVYS